MEQGTFDFLGSFGKSISALALMNLLPTRARRQASRLEFAGQDLLAMSEEKMMDIRGNRMSMIFQEPMTSLNPAYTIGDQLCEALLCHGRGTQAEAVDRAVFLPKKSGNQRQRASPQTVSPKSSPGPPPACGHWPNPKDEAGGDPLLRAHLFPGYLWAVQCSTFTA